jgi:hypothetical protein
LTNIPNSALSNSTIIINGNPISLGGTVNITTPNTILSQKGGLIVGTGGGSVTQFTVGPDGTIPIADSTQSTNLNWAGPINAAAKNFIINGDFTQWSRGTTFTSWAGYSADRWFTIYNENISRQSFSSVPEIPGGTYYLRWVAPTASYHGLEQRIENGALLLSGKTISLSFWAKSNTSNSFTLNFNTNLDDVNIDIKLNVYF